MNTPTACGMFYDDDDEIAANFFPPTIASIQDYLDEASVDDDEEQVIDLTTPPPPVPVRSSSASSSCEIIDLITQTTPVEVNNAGMQEWVEDAEDQEDVSDGDGEFSINTGVRESGYFSTSMNAWGASYTSDSSSLQAAILNGFNYSPQVSPNFSPNRGCLLQEAAVEPEELLGPELPEDAVEMPEVIEEAGHYNWPELPPGVMDIIDFIEDVYGELK